MMEHIYAMKTEMSSNLFAILAILSNLQVNRSVRFKDQPKSIVTEKQVADDATVDAVDVYH